MPEEMVSVWFCKIPDKYWEMKQAELRDKGVLKEKQALSPYRVAKDTGIVWETAKAWREGFYSPKNDAATVYTLMQYFGCSERDLVSDLNEYPRSAIDQNADNISEKVPRPVEISTGAQKLA